MKKRVVELFAGVGGFRVGLNCIDKFDKSGRAIETNDFEFVFANQWEPSTKIQPAFECYQKRFGKSDAHVNKDISTISSKDIPDHTLLVGGFPCQDYSVARSLSKEQGIQGKKGVLWWEIHRILKDKRPPFLLLENVDRLLRSPSSQRGRDFGIMLRSLNDLGYGVEWRVINASDYGGAQKRKRVFLFGFHNSTLFYKNISSFEDHLINTGVFAKAFPVKSDLSHIKSFTFDKNKDIVYVSDSFEFSFKNSGISINDICYTCQTEPIVESYIPLNDILETKNVDSSFFFTKEQLEKLIYLKGSKRISRVKPNGEHYYYSEGNMTFPDDLNSPGRTMLTSEGTINRSSHIVEDFKTKLLRRITPIEAERLNNFPDSWTDTMLTRHRYFMMGNALVTSIVKRLSGLLSIIIENESKES